MTFRTVRHLWRGIALLLLRRCEGPFCEIGLLRATLFFVNKSSLGRHIFKFLFRVTHPRKAVVIGDKNDTFFKYGWETLDIEEPADYRANIRRDPLPFSDGVLGYLYASHVLEHLNDQDLSHFLQECYRALAPEGFFRIVVPDLDLFLRSFKEDDLSLHFDRPATMLTAHSVRDGLTANYQGSPELLEPHNGLINVVASFTNGKPPLEIRRSEFNKHFSYDDLDGFVSWAAKLKPLEEDFGHCNGFNFIRLARFLREAGFDRVSRGFYRDPFVPIRLKDIDLANKQHISLYVNAAKS